MRWTARIACLIALTWGAVSPASAEPLRALAAGDHERPPVPVSIHAPDPPAQAPAGEGPSPIRYRITAAVEDAARIDGTALIEIDPVGEAPLEEVALFLFPNLLSERLPGDNDKSATTIHPCHFEAGGMQLRSLRLIDGPELPFTGVDVTRPDGRGREILLPGGTAVLARLPEASSTTVRLEARFSVEVPPRFGTFARYRGTLFLTGGWYPTVAARDPQGRWDLAAPLPRADAEVEVEVPERHWALVDDVLAAPPEGARAGATRRVRAEVLSRPTVLLAVSERLARFDDPAVTVLQTDREPGHARRMLRIARQARSFLVDEGLVPEDAPPGILFEAPLTRELAFHHAPVATFSFRAYRVFSPMKRYHDLHAARAMIAADVRDHVHRLEPGNDAAWVLDAAAWHLARRWERRKYGALRDVRDYARPLSFLPAVDLVLNTPDFPFAAEYYDNWYFTDLLRDDPYRFNHLQPNGRVAFEKLVDVFGEDAAADLMEAYLHGSPEDGGFRAVAERVTGRDLDPFFEVWRAPLPRVNYHLRNVRVEKLPSGQWMSVLTIVRQGDAVGEPVTVRVRAPGPDGTATWDALADEAGTMYVFTEGKPDAVEIDPNARLLEYDRRDNRVPPTWRMLLQYAYVDYEFELNTAEAGAAVQFERSSDLRNQIEMIGFHRQTSTGGAIGYAHSTGRFSFYRGLLHRFGVYLLVEDLAKDFGRDGLQVVPGFDPSRSEVDSTAGVLLSYRYDDREDWRFPRSGTRFYAAVEGGMSFQGPPARYFLAQADAVRLFRISDGNVLAFQGKVGSFFATDPSDVPLSKLFYLGGTDDVRGISAPEIVGPAKLVASVEWRHQLLRNLDWNLGVGRIRGLQGTLFADAGFISPRADVIPPLRRWVTDAGYGLRWHYDFLGVRPMIFRIDAAQRLDDLERTRKPDVRVYIGAGQSF